MVHVIFSSGPKDVSQLDLTLGPYRIVEATAETISAFDGWQPFTLAHRVETGWRVCDGFGEESHIFRSVRFSSEHPSEMRLPSDEDAEAN